MPVLDFKEIPEAHKATGCKIHLNFFLATSYLFWVIKSYVTQIEVLTVGLILSRKKKGLVSAGKQLSVGW